MFRLSTLTLLSASLCWSCQPAAAQFPTTDLPPHPTQAKPRVSEMLQSAEPSKSIHQQEERQQRSLPLSSAHSLQLARDFLHVLEDPGAPLPSFIEPTARLISQETKRERLLLDALKNQRSTPSGPTGSTAVFYQFHLSAGFTARDSSREMRSPPSQVTIHVEPLPGARTSSAQGWRLRLSDSSEGLRIIEVQTLDGQLPSVSSSFSP